MTEADILALTDTELETLSAKLRKRAQLQSALEMADLSVARYERPSEAVDRQLDRNMMVSDRIATLQRWVRDEQKRRAE